MKIAYNIYFGFCIISLLILMQSCKSDPDSPGIEYMPDMYRSPAIEPYVDYGEIRNKVNKNYKTRLSAMTPPNWTIPYCDGCDADEINMNLPVLGPSYKMKESHGLFKWDISAGDTTDFYEMAKDAKYSNPISYSKEVNKIGKSLYTSMCQHCHGEKGDGNGPMVVSGAYAGSGIPNYKTLNISDGQMFYSISYGKGNMGAHASILSKKEIWTLVHYVKYLQLGKEYTGIKKDVISDSTQVANDN